VGYVGVGVIFSSFVSLGVCVCVGGEGKRARVRVCSPTRKKQGVSETPGQ